ncbi:MAG: BamA/TamA family outer membrane protein [Tannerellaceae bacterium]|jgi:outer membrane protein assembly factor BamA|nr:BamA/TamA family outer membrane protein [Tannerellaceae bacterium]
MSDVSRVFVFIGFTISILSCNAVRFVENGEYLLDKVEVESDVRSYGPAELKPYLRQQPNFKAFGLVKWQLYVYGWSSKKNPEGWLSRQMRRMGEAPVIMDTTTVKQSAEELGRFLTNKGYTGASVTTTIDTSRNKRAAVTYRVKGNSPYVIRKYTMNFPDPTIDSIAHLKSPSRTWVESAFRYVAEDYIPTIAEGDLLDRDKLDKERQRITSLLRRNGYYAFNKDHLGYEADSSFSQNIVDLNMTLNPQRNVMPDGNVMESRHKQYYIKDVAVLTDYDALRLDGGEVFTPTDTVHSGTVSIIYGREGRTIRPGVLRRSNYMTPGSIFNERSLEQTYASFSALRALRNINIRLVETEENDTMKLHATILTAPAKVHGFGIDIEGTNSAGDLGFASSMNYQHRNLFRGSEVFAAKIRGAFESLSGSGEYGLDDYWEIGGEMSLSFPHFLLPFTKESFRRRINASTDFSLSYNRQTRPEYERAIVSGRWGYNWQSRNNAQARHSFNLVDVDYLFLPRIKGDFLNSLPATTRQYNYIDQFIISSSYGYTYNNYNPQYRERNTRSIRASAELAGNVLYALSNLTGAQKNDNGRYKLFGIEYSQYAKFDFDFSQGIILDNRSRLAFHLGAGLAAPYGNASQIPFERRYFSGGANSLRGWSVRSLGPGGMSKDSTDFIRQTGDIRLDVNLEYRTKLFWKFELAAFADAGNIWTIRSYADQKGGNFDPVRFLSEIAFSYGLGLRLDFDFVLFRFDVGLKAYDPQENGARRWAISRPNLTDNAAWHFAVGYPF